MSRIQHDLVAERTATTIRNIKSGNNECGTLFCGTGNELNEQFLAAAVRPALQVYEDEADQFRADRVRLSQESEERRQALEFIYSNAVGQLPKVVADRLCQVLGYCLAR
ncbi:MAG: hypothetical protein LUC93_05700 [Planctomycetaceae bacterium]|nr:hypothetical protein [Planctomycetaceae bacterium]